MEDHHDDPSNDKIVRVRCWLVVKGSRIIGFECSRYDGKECKVEIVQGDLTQKVQSYWRTHFNLDTKSIEASFIKLRITEDEWESKFPMHEICYMPIILAVRIGPLNFLADREYKIRECDKATVQKNVQALLPEYVSWKLGISTCEIPHVSIEINDILSGKKDPDIIATVQFVFSGIEIMGTPDGEYPDDENVKIENCELTEMRFEDPEVGDNHYSDEFSWLTYDKMRLFKSVWTKDIDSRDGEEIIFTMSSQDVVQRARDTGRYEELERSLSYEELKTATESYVKHTLQLDA